MSMSASSVSSQILLNSLLLPVEQAQSTLSTAMTEESTGQYANLGLQLGEQSGYELSLREQVENLQSLTTGNNLVGTNLSTALNALGDISSTAQSTLSDLTQWTPEAKTGTNLQAMGQSALQGLIASANTTAGGAYAFGGINSAAAPLADYFSTPASAAKTAVDQAFQTAFGFLPTDPAASSITAAQMQSFLSGPFAALFSGLNWTADWSQASNTNTTAAIAPGEMATISTSTNAPGFSELAEAYAMLAEFGTASLNAGTQQTLASAAQSLIAQGLSGITDTQATLGASKSRVTDATSAMSSQLTLLQNQIDGFDAVDQSAVATKIASLTNQIQMAYELTARLQQLNLAQYLPIP